MTRALIDTARRAQALKGTGRAGQNQQPSLRLCLDSVVGAGAEGEHRVVRKLDPVCWFDHPPDRKGWKDMLNASCKRPIGFHAK